MCSFSSSRTSDVSLHGAPSGTDGVSRNSIAHHYYYYGDEGHLCALRPTRYVARPAIRPPLDRWLPAAYSVVKRYTPLNDAFAARILRHF
jgi:hypothetical protein